VTWDGSKGGKFWKTKEEEKMRQEVF